MDPTRRTDKPTWRISIQRGASKEDGISVLQQSISNAVPSMPNAAHIDPTWRKICQIGANREIRKLWYLQCLLLINLHQFLKFGGSWVLPFGADMMK